MQTWCCPILMQCHQNIILVVKLMAPLVEYIKDGKTSSMCYVLAHIKLIDGRITWIYKRLEKLVVYVLCVTLHKIDSGITCIYKRLEKLVVYVLYSSWYKIDSGITWINWRLEKLVVYVLCVSSHKINGGFTWIYVLASVVLTHGRSII
jgi:hypothetical protein